MQEIETEGGVREPTQELSQEDLWYIIRRFTSQFEEKSLPRVGGYILLEMESNELLALLEQTHSYRLITEISKHKNINPLVLRVVSYDPELGVYESYQYGPTTEDVLSHRGIAQIDNMRFLQKIDNDNSKQSVPNRLLRQIDPKPLDEDEETPRFFIEETKKLGYTIIEIKFTNQEGVQLNQIGPLPENYAYFEYSNKTNKFSIPEELIRLLSGTQR